MTAERLFEGLSVTFVKSGQTESEKASILESNKTLLEQALRSVITLHSNNNLETEAGDIEDLALTVTKRGLVIDLSKNGKIEVTGLSYLNKLLRDVAKHQKQEDTEWYKSIQRELDVALTGLIGKRFPW